MTDWKRRCETLEHELTQVLTAVSHDLRAPLRAADGFSRALLSRPSAGLDPQALDYLQRIAQASVEMGQHIDAVCRLARVALARVRAERLDLGALAAAALAALRAAEPDRQIEVRIAPLEATADPVLMRILTDSLLGNAWRFTRGKPEMEIEVGSRQEGEGTVYFVRDTGVGFDMAQTRHLFEPFGRLHGEGGGAGMGLAIARRIVHRHGGRIWADAVPGRGATFSFTLGELDTA
jgi:signal transduction histidine kinase